MITEQQKQIILSVLRPYNPVEVGIFGSFARGEESPESDLDILVGFSKDTVVTLFDWVNLENQLKRRLKRKVDLVEKEAIHPRIHPFVQKDLIYIYGQAG